MLKPGFTNQTSGPHKVKSVRDDKNIVKSKDSVVEQGKIIRFIVFSNSELHQTGPKDKLFERDIFMQSTSIFNNAL